MPNFNCVAVLDKDLKVALDVKTETLSKALDNFHMFLIDRYDLNLDTIKELQIVEGSSGEQIFEIGLTRYKVDPKGHYALYEKAPGIWRHSSSVTNLMLSNKSVA